MSLPIEQMLKDAAVVERLCQTDGGLSCRNAPALDLCCHVKALAAEVETLTIRIGEAETTMIDMQEEINALEAQLEERRREI